MKIMIASDIHGSGFYCEKMIKAYQREEAERLILLGDLLYHGPRNDLPKEYDPKKTAALLNEMRREILCVKGNCEAAVDQMVLSFPVMAEYAFLCIDALTIFATHGDIYNLSSPPPLKRGDILLHGHTHVQALMEENGIFYLNPGSISIPKEGNENSYMVYENHKFTIKNLEGEQISEIKIGEQGRHEIQTMH